MDQERQVVKQLDHLILHADDPQPLFRLLSETLQLPVAWPLRSYPSFTSGGITVGNLYLEVLSCAPKRDSSSNLSPDARFAAIAFETDSLDDTVRELDRHKIPHGPVTIYMQIEADGRKTELYSNAILGRLLGPSFWIDTMIVMGKLPGAGSMANPGAGGLLVRWGMDKVMRGNLVFLVEYAYQNFKDLPHWSEFKNHSEKRAADKRTLDSRGGGELGVEFVREIVAEVKEIEDAQTYWRGFLGPDAESSSGRWEIADGPAVRLLSSISNGIQSLVLKVSSLKRAETFLAQKGMLVAPKEDQLTISPEKIYGLDVRLVE